MYQKSEFSPSIAITSSQALTAEVIILSPVWTPILPNKFFGILAKEFKWENSSNAIKMWAAIFTVWLKFSSSVLYKFSLRSLSRRMDLKIAPFGEENIPLSISTILGCNK